MLKKRFRKLEATRYGSRCGEPLFWLVLLAPDGEEICEQGTKGYERIPVHKIPIREDVWFGEATRSWGPVKNAALVRGDGQIVKEFREVIRGGSVGVSTFDRVHVALDLTLTFD